MPHQTNTLVIGAGISGLAMAASLQKKGIDYILIEKEAQAFAPWRYHYERLHLHTNKSLSALPYKKFGCAIPRYPSRQQVVDYLEDYQQTFDIHPVFNAEARSAKKSGDHWITETANGVYESKYIVMATGAYGKPKPVHFNGMESFPGNILHSYRYKTGRDFTGQQLLVVGFGNSACEIAIDLYEQGASPAMAVRSPVNVIPRDIFGLPILRISLLLSRLPTGMADAISAPMIRSVIGDIGRLGLKKMPYGPFEQIRKDGTIPVLDIGVIQHIREGHVAIYDNIDRIEGRTVHFGNGKKADFDAIVAAIGYETHFPEILPIDKKRFEDLNQPVDRQKYFGADGLYFCGFWIGPTGVIREISSDAKKIAGDIAGKEKRPS
jgi:indole-3-pyruvate monooxygenase